MKRSSTRILTTHVGSLSRTKELQEMIQARETGKPHDAEALATSIRGAVADVVKKQADAGVDHINDGEQSKPNAVTYVRARMNGFGPAEVQLSPGLDQRMFPEYQARRAAGGGASQFGGARPAVTGPLSWKDFSPVQVDIDNMKAAVSKVKYEEAFLTSLSPGWFARIFPNKYYPTRAAYLEAFGEVIKKEYDAIVKAGFVVQLDAPDFALRDSWQPDASTAEFRKLVAEGIDALNHAMRDIPADRVRVHACWGLPEGPKYHDIPLKGLADLLVKVKGEAISIAAANGRHQYEWKVWKDIKLPTGKILIPGIGDSTTNIIEHPETVADRLVNYASVVGRENVIAGFDCGFGTSPTGDVDPRISYAKMKAVADGAALASKELWKK